MKVICCQCYVPHPQLQKTVLNASTLICLSEPGRPPTDIVAKQIGYTDIYLIWDEINPKYVFGKFIGYGVQYYSLGNDNSNKVNHTTYCNFTITNLTHNTEYQVRVAGITEGGIGVFSKYVNITTRKSKSCSLNYLECSYSVNAES